MLLLEVIQGIDCLHHTHQESGKSMGVLLRFQSEQNGKQDEPAWKRPRKHGNMRRPTLYAGATEMLSIEAEYLREASTRILDPGRLAFIRTNSLLPFSFAA